MSEREILMLKLFNKSKILFAVMWIVIYIVGASLGDMLSEAVHIEKIFTAVILAVLSAIVLLFLIKNRFLKEYGLCLPDKKPVQLLFYIPLLFISSVNMWFEPVKDKKLSEILLFMLSMCCVGFLEEIIFRGFLFKAMAENGTKSAIAVSSITFGIGHILNLFNGNSESVIATICQICYCIAIGFLFVMLFVKTGSILPQIAVHCIVNATSIFSDTSSVSDKVHIITAVVITAVALIYAVSLIKIKNKTSKEL